MFSKRGSNDTIRDMTKPLNYHIVIDRKDLPEVLWTGNYVSAGEQTNYYGSSAHAEMSRKRAYELLAIAEEIDRSLALDQEMKLRDEARKLFEASRERMNKDGLTCPAWEKLDAKNIAHWEHIARAARELHGK